MPSSVAARNTRIAISERLATSRRRKRWGMACSENCSAETLLLVGYLHVYGSLAAGVAHGVVASSRIRARIVARERRRRACSALVKDAAAPGLGDEGAIALDRHVGGWRAERELAGGTQLRHALRAAADGELHQTVVPARPRRLRIESRSLVEVDQRLVVATAIQQQPAADGADVGEIVVGSQREFGPRGAGFRRALGVHHLNRRDARMLDQVFLLVILSEVDGATEIG